MVHGRTRLHRSFGVEITPTRHFQSLIRAKPGFQPLQWLIGHQAQGNDQGFARGGPLRQLELQPTGPSPPLPLATADTRSTGPGSAALPAPA